MRTRSLMLIAIAALVVSTAACQKKDKPADAAKAGAQTAAADASKTSGTQPAAGGSTLPEVIARVNGTDVKRTELETALRALEAQAGGPVPEDQKATVRKQVIDRLVGYHLLVAETKVRNVVASGWDVDKRIAEIKGQFPNEQAFKDMLKERNLTEDRLRQETAESLAVNTMLEKETSSLPAATDDDLRKFYDGNKPRFHQAASVHVSHILVRLEQNADVATRDKARAALVAIQGQIKAGGDFAALAQQYSQDPGSAAKGGDLGFFARGQMVPAFEEVAFKTKPGQVSGIVETPFGFHLIKGHGSRPARDVPFDEVKEQIRQFLSQQAGEQKTQSLIDQLKAKAKVDILI